jgi:hypothetical protein
MAPVIGIVPGSKAESHLSQMFSFPEPPLKIIAISQFDKVQICRTLGVKRIGELYRIEAELRGHSAAARLAGRQERSRH